MKKIVFALLLVTYAGLAIASDQDFTIMNKTGMEIAKLYISPSAMEDWGGDVLSVDTLATGDECDILVSRNESAEVWDLLIIAPDGTLVKWPGLRLNDFSRITLSVEKGQPVAYFE